MKINISQMLCCAFFFLMLVSYPLPDISAEESPTFQAASDMDDDEAELKRLLSVIQTHTEIATKSKLNVDYVPGMVTVLEGENLLSRGVRNVGEALRLVAGISVSTGRFGTIAISIRGLSETYHGPSNNLVMFNGVPVNMLVSGPHAFLNIPIGQVDRIEVIRGPGSAVHGGYANTGVINIITRSQGNAVYGEAGKYDTYGAGGLFSLEKPDHDFTVSLNVSGWDTDGADTLAGPDILYSMGQAAISNAPGPINEDRSTHSAVMTMDYKDFSIKAQYFKLGQGDHFGISHALPPDTDGIVFENEYKNIELAQRVSITSSLWLNLKLGYLSSEQSSDDRISMFPPGIFLGGYTHPYGMNLAVHYEESRYDGAVSLTWDGLEHHRIYTEYAISHTYQGDESWRKANFNIDTYEPDPANEMQQFDGALVGKDRERRIHSIVVQDEFSASDTLDITAGVRYDHYNDTDDSISPRLAGAWRISKSHILKAQYAQAYMPPSFLQLYYQQGTQSLPNPDLKPQTSENFELGYIYREPGQVVRITLFHTDVENIIVLGSEKWINAGRAELIGVELELERSLLSSLKLEGNISYAHTEDEATGEPVPETPNFLANVGLSYEPLHNLILNAQYRYVGEQNRDPADTRKKADAFSTVDLSVSLFNLFTRGLTLRAGVKNILDEDVRYAAPINTYPEDYPQDSRRWWTELSYEF